MTHLSAEAQIEALAITVRFGSFTALDAVDLQVRQGEFLSLLGPSGSGKTTFLTVLAGFLAPTSGRLLLDGRDVTRIVAKDRGFGMVFQGYALFPHMSVVENIAFPLKVQKRSHGQIRDRVAAMIHTMGLAGHEDKKPTQLSGGQQQRVALARALAYEPPILLLDEPFSALDKNLREQMQQELRRLHRELGTTFIFVTHDQSEAFALSNRIAIFKGGALQQVGTPEEVYAHPADRFIAEFLGEINILPIDRSDGCARVCGQVVELPESQADATRSLAIRPEHMRLALAGETAANVLPVRLQDRIYLGADMRLALEGAGGARIVLDVPVCSEVQALTPGAELRVCWKATDSFLV